MWFSVTTGSSSQSCSVMPGAMSTALVSTQAQARRWAARKTGQVVVGQGNGAAHGILGRSRSALEW